MLQVRETSEGREISAWLIFQSGKEVGKVHGRHTRGGYQVDLWDYRAGNGGEYFQQKKLTYTGAGAMPGVNNALAGMVFGGRGIPSVDDGRELSALEEMGFQVHKAI